jgi:two-component system CheB/CheR fusion protein
VTRTTKRRTAGRAQGAASKSHPARKSQPGNPSDKRAKRPAGSHEPPRPKAVADRRSRAPSATTERPDRPETTRAAAFPVVGIGASAGGLEALELFLQNVPEDTGMAFVIVQHLDPTYKGMLIELLQRATPIPVVQAKARMKVEPDHVYVIPPNRDLSLVHGELHLVPQAMPRGLNLPIDFFFRSLAEDRQESSIGVILSGMGSDGTLGLRAIKEKAGAAFVQTLSSAKFDSMPRSAVDAGLADVVAPAEELPKRILAYARHAWHITKRDVSDEDRALGALQKVFTLLRGHTGNDFSAYKKSTVYRRIERRMGLHQIDTVANYVRFLRDNPHEINLLFKELLIGVTTFFRDPGAWEHLRHDVMPALISSRAPGGVLRAWVPACSTGEEAYSLAMAFQEALEPFKPVKNLSVQIFATDLDPDAIDKARLGVYPDNIAADVSPERLRRFFVQEQHGYRVAKEIREMVVFANQNLIMDAPFTRLDVLCCRNLLIYLSVDLQKKLIPLFHYSLNPGGVLFLGSAETIGAFSSLFAPLDAKTRLYRRLAESVASVPVEFPAGAFAALAAGSETDGEAGPRKASASNLQHLADRLIVQQYAPVALLCNEKGDILYTSGRTGKYLEPSVGKASMNVFGMAREGLRYELSTAFSAALRDKGPVTVRGLRIGANGSTQAADLTVHKLTEPKELSGTVIVVLKEVDAVVQAPAKTRGRAESTRLPRLEEEIRRARDEVQTTREEMQTSQEELKSTNEELQSANEELQSTNEELTTSKEEMQSLNEELQTVNHELQSKVEELSRSNNDMKNLLNSTDIATLFLDSELRVRRFTTPLTRIIKLIPGDTGRSITDFATELEYPELAHDVREVLRTLAPKDKQVATRDGRWFTVRMMAYRTLENVIDGVVLTFTEATEFRKLESKLREQASSLRQLTESLPTLVWSARPDGPWDYLGHQWVSYTGVPEAEQEGYRWLEQVHTEDRERVGRTWAAAVSAGTQLDVEFRIRAATGEYRWFKTRATPIRDSAGMILKWYGTSTDIDDLKR